MKTLTFTFLLLLICFQPLTAQEIGVPVPVEIAETSTTLTLDFSNCDYELILYSIDTHLENQCVGTVQSVRLLRDRRLRRFESRFGWQPRGQSASAPFQTKSDLESMLRAQERELASRLQESGGYRTHAAKIVPQQIGSTRQFVFPSFGDVSKTTVTASLVASGERAIVYVDVADIHRLRKDSLQAQVDRFSKTIYPMVTSAFGPASDVDNDGKIHLLYTNLVNRDGSIFGAAGFFHAPSLLPTDQGGDGNLSDMFYLDPDIDPSGIDAVLAHEFQHLINFNQRVLVRNGQPEELWLNEGLSHFCEDLIGENGATMKGESDSFLNNTTRGPLGTNLTVDRASRGALYLFIRSLVEEFGLGIVARLVQTDKVGYENIEAATGGPFGGHIRQARCEAVFERIGPQHETQLYISASCRPHFASSGVPSPQASFSLARRRVPDLRRRRICTCPS